MKVYPLKAKPRLLASVVSVSYFYITHVFRVNLSNVVLNMLLSYMVVPSFNVEHIHNKFATRLGFCTAINDNDYVY